MIDRRSLLGAAALVPALAAASRADACSLVVPSPDQWAQRIPAIRSLMAAWFARDRAAFLVPFYRPPAQPDASDAAVLALARGDKAGSVLPAFENLFADTARPKQINAITIVGDAAFVAVTEAEPGGIGPDCSGMPTQHLLIIRFGAFRPFEAITIVDSRRFSGYAPAASWIG